MNVIRSGDRRPRLSRRRLRFETRIVVTALLAVVPLILALLVMLIATHASLRAMPRCRRR